MIALTRLQKIFSSWATPISSAPSMSSEFLQATGRVIMPLVPGEVGRIQLQGVSWLARLAATVPYPLPVGTPVRVVNREGLTLIVVALEQAVPTRQQPYLTPVPAYQRPRLVGPSSEAAA